MNLYGLYALAGALLLANVVILDIQEEEYRVKKSWAARFICVSFGAALIIFSIVKG